MFKDNLIYYRKRKGLTQRELAARLYVSRQAVSKWERGVNEPDIQTLKRLCDILDCTSNALLGDDRVAPDTADARSRAALNRTMLLWTLLLTVFCILTVAVLYRFLPDIIPAHQTHGKIDRYGDKAEIWLFVSVFAVFAGVDCMIFAACKKYGDKKATAIGHSVILAMILAFELFISIMYMRYVPTAELIPATASHAAALALIIWAGISPRLTPPNKIYGVRTHLTLSDAAAWKKVNNAAALSGTITSAAVFAATMSFAGKYAYIAFAAYIIPVAVVCAVHANCKRKSR